MIWIDGVSSVHLIAGLIMQVLATLMIVGLLQELIARIYVCIDCSYIFGYVVGYM